MSADAGCSHWLGNICLYLPDTRYEVEWCVAAAVRVVAALVSVVSSIILCRLVADRYPMNVWLAEVGRERGGASSSCH